MSPLSFGRFCENAKLRSCKRRGSYFSSFPPCARAHFLVFRTPPEGNRSFASAWLQVGRDGGIIIVRSCVIVAATSSHNLKTCRHVLRVSGTVASNVQHEGLSQRMGHLSRCRRMASCGCCHLGAKVLATPAQDQHFGLLLSVRGALGTAIFFFWGRALRPAACKGARWCL